jgi:hypothetical protein
MQLSPKNEVQEAHAKTLEEIKHLTRPGQKLSPSDAIDVICDVYNLARASLSSGDR